MWTVPQEIQEQVLRDVFVQNSVVHFEEQALFHHWLKFDGVGGHGPLIHRYQGGLVEHQMPSAMWALNALNSSPMGYAWSGCP